MKTNIIILKIYLAFIFLFRNYTFNGFKRAWLKLYKKNGLLCKINDKYIAIFVQ